MFSFCFQNWSVFPPSRQTHTAVNLARRPRHQERRDTLASPTRTAPVAELPMRTRTPQGKSAKKTVYCPILNSAWHETVREPIHSCDGRFDGRRDGRLTIKKTTPLSFGWGVKPILESTNGARDAASTAERLCECGSSVCGRPRCAVFASHDACFRFFRR